MAAGNVRRFIYIFSLPPRSAKFELWVTGTVSALARKQLEAKGIKVAEKVDGCIGMMD
jgi:hypothetical protein